MTDIEQRAAAKAFAEYWRDKGDEKGESQKFWLSLLRDVYGVEHPEQYISFEDRVFLGHASFIDGYIGDTKVLIEQKAIGKDLKKPVKQSDGTLLTPFQQAKRYVTELPVSRHPHWVVTSNFSTFLVYDMENPSGEPEEILLENLETEFYRLSFLVDNVKAHLKREMEISMQAGDIVGLLYAELLKQYVDPTDANSLKSLNMLCVRLVFCLYAEDAGVFGRHMIFHDYMSQFEAKAWRNALIELFRVLDTKEEDRDKYLDEDLAAFPYVNGGLFANEDIEIPRFNDRIVELILVRASEDFNWSEISPTIFGAVFESTLNPETRRSGGMHYTSIENIHKVIDPLFLDDVTKELGEIKEIQAVKTREKKLKEYQKKLAGLVFLDPACGSGNFLTETYISIRRLENAALACLHQGQITFGGIEMLNPIQVSIKQFYGIEINDFAVTVAKTALWIAEHQMMKETEDVVHMPLDFLPLKSYTNIIEGNALKIDWEEVVSKNKLNYIMGNPPFIGYAYQSAEQKNDIQMVMAGAGKNMDYVTAWYFKAAQLVQNSSIKAAFVSTNSITQGEQAAVIWKPLIQKYGISIHFAWRTFKWNSESKEKAAVHCVIIGFQYGKSSRKKKLFVNEQIVREVDNISPYLIDSPNIFVERRRTPLYDVPDMVRGSQPTDDGNLILTEGEKEDFLKEEPQAAIYIRPFMMGRDFINRKPRYCLWLVGANPAELKKCPRILERVEGVREFRLKSKKGATREKANTPTLFDEIRECKTDYIAIPKVSSENRRYIPMEYLDAEIIAGDQLFMVQNASLFDFGVLTSNVHMAWMRMVCGRLKSDYRYSNTIIYNNFPWCSASDEQKAKIEKTARAILDARELYPDNSLADLYDEVLMPPELRKAHQQNDKAVMQAYGFSIKDTTEASCAAELMKMYQAKCKAQELR